MFRRTYPRVLAYARTMAGAADAEDAVAEAFATAWRRRNDIPAHAQLGWMIGVTRRVLANRRRTDRRLGALRERLAFQRNSLEAPGPIDLLDRGLRDELAALPATDREALLLVAWFDLSPTDAAQVLGITPAAFRMRLTRARRRMSPHLDPSLTKEPRWQTH